MGRGGMTKICWSFRGRAQRGTWNRFIFTARLVIHGSCMREPAVYMLATKPYGTLYIGVTSDLVKRIWEHRNDAVEGFSKRYRVHRLVHFEQFRSMVEAIEREKELKKWRRAWKIALVEKTNPGWRDLWPEISQ